MQGELGTYLALTGNPLYSEDLLYEFRKNLIFFSYLIKLAFQNLHLKKFMMKLMQKVSLNCKIQKLYILWFEIKIKKFLLTICD